eukprot:scaffold795_cov195-Alexandrium_tamarense.AAC.8
MPGAKDLTVLCIAAQCSIHGNIEFCIQEYVQADTSTLDDIPSSRSNILNATVLGARTVAVILGWSRPLHRTKKLYP